MTVIVEFKLELGQRAKVRDPPSAESHTHDWVVFVKGCDGVKMEHFVEKIVFWLHDCYEPSKRVVKRPPYEVVESGYAEFLILIDVHYRNLGEPKTLLLQHDLRLPTKTMSLANHTRIEKLKFRNPSQDFLEKLLKGGAIFTNPSSLPSPRSLPIKKRPLPMAVKKERCQSNDDLKSYNGSSYRLHDEKKCSASEPSVSKIIRFSGKDMTNCRKESKHLEPSKKRKSFSGIDKARSDRAKPRKRRSDMTGCVVGGKKMRTEHSSN